MASTAPVWLASRVCHKRISNDWLGAGAPGQRQCTIVSPLIAAPGFGSITVIGPADGGAGDKVTVGNLDVVGVIVGGSVGRRVGTRVDVGFRTPESAVVPPVVVGGEGKVTMIVGLFVLSSVM